MGGERNRRGRGEEEERKRRGRGEEEERKRRGRGEGEEGKRERERKRRGRAEEGCRASCFPASRRIARLSVASVFQGTGLSTFLGDPALNDGEDNDGFWVCPQISGWRQRHPMEMQCQGFPDKLKERAGYVK